jgi:Putative phage metallopeptidase
MPTTFKRCDESVTQLASEILCEFESHKPLLDAKVRIDYVFACPDLDEDGTPKNDALKRNGVKALGITRKLGAKDRALGRGDAEVALDHFWWTETASDEMRRALLDHELHHVSVVIGKQSGLAVREEDGRPKIKLRKHDVDVGWFRIVAERHGEHSMERIQARQLMESSGQLFWPDIVGK